MNIYDQIYSFNEILEESNINSGIIFGCYNLDNPISGFIVKNDLIDIQNQYFISGGSFVINSSGGLGILSNSGSNIFKNNQNLKIFKTVTGDRVSIFVDIESLKSNQTELNEILSIDSVSAGTNSFRISIEANRYNNLFVRYSGQKDNFLITGINKTDIDLDANSLISLRLNPFHFYLDKFDFREDNIISEFFNFSFTGDKKISFGKNQTTSFEGKINNILLAEDYLNPNTTRAILKTFLKTGEKEVSSIEYKLLSTGEINATFNPSGIIGTEIRAFTPIINNLNLNTNSDLSFREYSLSGITGYATGEKIEYSIGSSLYPIEVKNIYNLYDLNEAKKYVKNNIIFTNNIEDTDFVEIQAYPAFCNISKEIFDGFSGIRPSALVNIDRNNLYINGIYNKTFAVQNQIYINDWSGLDRDDYLNNLKIFDNFTSLSGYSYEYDGTYYIDTQAVGAWRLVPTNENLDKKYNIFLNGLKLASGNGEYFISRSSYSNLKYQLYINRLINSLGQVDIVEDNYLFKTGNSWSIIKNNINLITGRKAIWVNGVFQHINSDYIEYFSEDISGLSYTSPAVSLSGIFNNDLARFKTT